MNDSAKRVLCNYILAKDGNRPHLLRQVFADDAVLDMDVRTDGIRFPTQVQSLEAIADTLVRQFCATYENITTLYLSAPPDTGNAFSCDWFVGMTEKSSGNARVGSGRYEWRFTGSQALRATHLRIRINVMETLPQQQAQLLLDWLSSLPYPWCTPQALIASAPRIDGLQKAIADYIPQLEACS